MHSSGRFLVKNVLDVSAYNTCSLLPLSSHCGSLVDVATSKPTRTVPDWLLRCRRQPGKNVRHTLRVAQQVRFSEKSRKKVCADGGEELRKTERPRTMRVCGPNKRTHRKQLERGAAKAATTCRFSASLLGSGSNEPIVLNTVD